MPQLTFMQKMADKASRLLPSSFSEIVYDTTSEVLTSPDYENIMFICDQTNRDASNAKDVVLAIRRRIEDNNPKVQYFTIILLDALIKNCYEELHNQVADSPALQNCLVEIAVRTPIRDGGFEAKKAALQLILNMSYWFIGATEDRTKMLSKLADEVRQQTTPLAFEDIEADAAFQLKRAPPRQQQQQQSVRRTNTVPAGGGAQPTSRPGSASHQSNRNASSAPQRVVEAIPVIQYTGEEISGMLDSCMLLNETMNSAEEDRRTIVGDEIVASIAVQVRRDHRKLAILLSSGAQMDNLDVLLSVSDSQTAVIQRLSAAVERDGRNIRDVAGMGAEEDENSAVTLHNANRPVPQQVHRPPPQVTSSTIDYDGKTTSLQKNHSTKPRRADNDEGEEMGDSSSSPPGVPAAAPLTSQTSGAASTSSPTRRTAGDKSTKSNDQELDDFFGGSASAPAHSAPQGDHNTLYSPTGNDNSASAVTSSAPRTSAAPAPYQLTGPSQPVATDNGPRTAPNTDFFEANNAPSAGVTAPLLGSVNGGTGERDEFDDFLNSRLAQ